LSNPRQLWITSNIFHLLLYNFDAKQEKGKRCC
jgi:hypothetical protein